MAASYGVLAAAVERAFERGVDYLYWGSFRRGPFGQALRNLKPQRERLMLVLQSYSRAAALTRPSVEIALRKLNFEYADVLLTGPLEQKAAAPDNGCRTKTSRAWPHPSHRHLHPSPPFGFRVVGRSGFRNRAPALQRRPQGR
jgi:hypothetical protein